MSAEDETLGEQEYVAEAIFQHNNGESAPLLLQQDAATRWTRKPSLFWLFIPFFFTAIMSGASITPRLSLISDLLCRSYYASRVSEATTAAGAAATLHETGEVFNCNIAAISGHIARLSTSLNTVTGLLGAMTAAKYGLWSDRNGRRYPLMITMLGAFMNDLCYILVGRYYEHLTIYFLFIGAICDGLTGSFMAMMAATYTYTTDVVPPQKRAVAFGYLQCCFYGGLALGPTVGGYLVKRTGNVQIIFYLAMGVHAVFALWTLFILPESLSDSRMEIARIKRASMTTTTTTTTTSTTTTVLQFFNIFKELRVFFPKNVHRIIKRNLVLLMVIDICLLFNMGAFTVIILYAKFTYNWGDLEQGYLLSLIGGTRVLVLLGVLPIVVRLVRGKVSSLHVDDADGQVEHAPEGADVLDVYLIRVSMVLEVTGFVLFATAPNSSAFYVAGGISALAGVGMPTLASVLTKHVPSTQTGHLLGAVALMQSLNRVFSPLLFGLLYSATVATHPATCFVVLAALMALGFLSSLALRPSTVTHLESSSSSSQEE